MRTVLLGRSGLSVSAIAFGGMSLTPERRADGIGAVHAALAHGITLFDTADIYAGGDGERILGEALGSAGVPRDRYRIASKCGIVPPGSRPGWTWKAYDTSAEAIVRGCEGSLRRLGVDHLDVWYLHRIDHLAHPHEIAGALDQLRAAGKIGHAAVSNHTGPELAALAACTPLVALQTQFSILHQEPLEAGLHADALRLGLALLAWSPLAGGLLGAGKRASGGKTHHDDWRSQRLEGAAAQVAAMAHDLGVAPATLALAWLMQLPGGVIPIVGTATAAHLADAVAAVDLVLRRDQWYELMVIGRGRPMPWQQPPYAYLRER